MRRYACFFLLLLLAKAVHANHWEPDPYLYPDNMNVMGIVEINGVEEVNESLELGAFCDGECRGSEMLTYYAGLGRCLVFMTIYGETGDTLSFRLYDHASQQELELTPSETMLFVSNGIVGAVHEPYVFSFTGSTEGMVDQLVSCVSMYPNPTKDEVMINGREIETVKVYNALGQLVYMEECGNADNLELHLNGLSAGVYTVNVWMANGQQANKRIVKE